MVGSTEDAGEAANVEEDEVVVEATKQPKEEQRVSSSAAQKGKAAAEKFEVEKAKLEEEKTAAEKLEVEKAKLVEKGASPSLPVRANRVQQRIAWLNTVGGFKGDIFYPAVQMVQCVGEVDEEKVLKVLHSAWMLRKQIHNPTEWICDDLRFAEKGMS